MSAKHMNFSEFPQFGVLSSAKVLITGTNIAGPYAGGIMAEIGAKVIQVEHPKMPCQTRGNYGYIQNRRNEFSVTLDSSTEDGKKVFEKLIQWADIWIESGRPGSYAKRGLDDEHLWTLNPALAIVHVSGYGQYGPYKDKAAYDVSGQAMGGYMYLNGAGPTSPPTKVNPYLSDYVTAMNACICALSIMTHARVTGKGDSADVSQYESMFRLLDAYPIDWRHRGYPATGEPVRWRTGNVSDQACGFSFYDCKDGGTIFIGMVGVGNTKKGYPLIGLPEPGTGDPDFPEGMTGTLIYLPVGQRVEAALKKFCAERTVDEVEAIMTENGIPNQRAYGPEEIFKDPHYAAREDFLEWEDPLYGKITGMGIVNKFSQNPGQVVAPAPLFGEHNREVFKELGFDDAFIEKLYENGDTKTMDAKETSIYWKLKEFKFFWDEEQWKRLGID